jgi:hypothetical protein
MLLRVCGFAPVWPREFALNLLIMKSLTLALGALLDEREVAPSPEERADAPAQQVENFVDIADLEQFVKKFVKRHPLPLSFSHRLYCHGNLWTRVAGKSGRRRRVNGANAGRTALEAGLPRLLFSVRIDAR